MSKLKTFVAVDIAGIVQNMPPKSSVESYQVRCEKNAGGMSVPIGIEIIWNNDNIKTGRTYPFEYPVQKFYNDKVFLASSENAGKRNKK